jgi:hypothetical protein
MVSNKMVLCHGTTVSIEYYTYFCRSNWLLYCASPCRQLIYTVIKGSRVSRPRPGCHYQTRRIIHATKLSLGGNNDVITELFLPRGSLVSDIPAGDGKLVNLFLRCRQVSTCDTHLKSFERGNYPLHHLLNWSRRAI